MLNFFLLEFPFSADETKLKMMQEVSENFEVIKNKKPFQNVSASCRCVTLISDVIWLKDRVS